MLKVARFLRSYLRAPADVDETEVPLVVDGREVPATLLLPRDGRPVPGWVVLHGITVPGRHHAGLRRFTRALAGSGSVVLIPEIGAWRELRIAPELTERTIAASARMLSQRPEVLPGGVGVVGFSFGATQALVTAARGDLSAPIRSLTCFGGYCDLERLVRFMLTGEHEWNGVTHRLEPDPYGRWIVAGNYLTAVPEHAHQAAVAEAALSLAREAGALGISAADPHFTMRSRALRAGMSREERALWDLIAPPMGTVPAPEAANRLARQLVEAALKIDPTLDPLPLLPRVGSRVVLAHGHQDRLIPFTESLRLRAHLPRDSLAHLGITRLFAHSREAEGLRTHQYPIELFRYLRLLQRALDPA